jgi:ABC-2 type transport system permease protein
MTAATSGRPVSAAAASGDTSGLRPIFLDIARSEWVKLHTVRSTYRTLLVMAVSMVGVGALLTAAYLRHHASSGPAARAAFDPAAYSLSGFFPAQLAIGVLGVLIITSEYATGSIRSTFAAAPQRGTVLAAKAAVFAAVAVVTGIRPHSPHSSPGRPSCPATALKRTSATPQRSAPCSAPVSTWPCSDCSPSGSAR